MHRAGDSKCLDESDWNHRIIGLRVNVSKAWCLINDIRFRTHRDPHCGFFCSGSRSTLILLLYHSYCLWLCTRPILRRYTYLYYDPPHDKINNMACAPSEDRSTMASAWRKLGSLATHWVYSKDWSYWADAQTDLSLRWAHMPFCWFCHVAAQLWSASRFNGGFLREWISL